jgi:hypothetical protein
MQWSEHSFWMALLASCLVHAIVIGFPAKSLLSPTLATPKPLSAKIQVVLADRTQSASISAINKAASQPKRAQKQDISSVSTLESEEINLFFGYYAPADVAYPAHVLSPIELYLDQYRDLLAAPANNHASLRIYINADGHADEVIVESSDFPVHVLAEALQQFRQARYLPAIRNDEQVKSWLRIELSTDN